MNMNTPVNSGGEWFPFMEQMGVDRRHAVLDISTETDESQKFSAEIFDVITKNIVWRGYNFSTEESAFIEADLILERLERVNGFGSLASCQEG